MKTFKDYLKNKEAVLSWDSGHAEQRNKSDKDSILSWDSGHAEQRNKKVTEEVTNTTKINAWGLKEDNPMKNKTNPKGGTYDSSIHDHPEVKPKRILYNDAISNYTSAESKSLEGHGSSKNVNGYLRNRMGDKKVGVVDHPHQSVLDSVKLLSKNFTPQNTNRKEITTYSGVPDHIGEKLEAGKSGDIHHLAGFTSTSTSKRIANEFAESNATKNKQILHVVKFTVQPGAGLSVAHKSEFNENEVMLHHGAKTTYSHTEINHGLAHSRPGALMVETHIHHVTVHPTHKKLEDYGSYDTPK